MPLSYNYDKHDRRDILRHAKALEGYAVGDVYELELHGKQRNKILEYYAEKSADIKGAAAELVANGEVKAALGVDMNGSTRRSAALSGVDFLKPTYGTVSRYGIISCAASGEQLGVYAKNAEGIKEIMDVIAGHDDKDGTSLRNESYDYTINSDVSGKKVCIIKELMDKADEDVKAKVNAYAESLRIP